MIPNLPQFLAECARVLGDTGVDGAEIAASRHGRNTIAAVRSPGGSVRPLGVADVQRVVGLARAHGVGLYPIGTGHNWGYGGALPHRDGDVILDLSGMNRILGHDAALGVVVVEPGVTTGQLHAYLRTHALDYMVPVTGAGPSNSLIGNALERGFGLVPGADHFQAITALKAVLADGRLYQSALAELDGSDIDNLHRWGVGPFIDGLFAQGNVGIVVEASIALARTPEETAVLLMGTNDENPERAIDFIQRATQRFGAQIGGLQLSNRVRFAGSRADAGGPPAYAWNLVGTLYGDRAIVKHVGRSLLHDARGIFGTRRMLTHRAVKRLVALAAILPRAFSTSRLGRQIALIDEFSAFIRGLPIDSVLRNFAYRGRIPGDVALPLNPDRDDCGIVWYAPLIPLRARSVLAMIDVVTPVLAAHGIELSLALSTLSPLCLDATIALQFDKADAAATARARQCYRDLFEAGRRGGFIPYRVGLQGMDLLVDDGHVFWQVARSIKRALDPDDVIAPGRYDIGDRTR